MVETAQELARRQAQANAEAVRAGQPMPYPQVGIPQGEQIYWGGPKGDIPYAQPPSAPAAEVFPLNTAPAGNPLTITAGPIDWNAAKLSPPGADLIDWEAAKLYSPDQVAAHVEKPQVAAPSPTLPTPGLGQLLTTELPGMEAPSPPRDAADFQQRKQGWLDVLNKMANDPEIMLMLFRLGTGLMQGEPLGAALQGSADFYFTRQAAQAKQKAEEQKTALETRKAEAQIELNKATAAKTKSETPDADMAKRLLEARLAAANRQGKTQPTQVDAIAELVRKANPDKGEDWVAKETLRIMGKGEQTEGDPYWNVALEMVKGGYAQPKNVAAIAESLRQQQAELIEKQYETVGKTVDGHEIRRNRYTGQLEIYR